MLVRLGDLAAYLDSHRGSRGAPVGPELAGWLPHYLAALSHDEGWGLDEDFFLAQLERPCVVLLDGLDEAPGRIARGSLSRLIENVAAGYPVARIVVTSRPGAYVGEAMLQGFGRVQVDPLDERAVHTFLERWCRTLFPESQAEATRHGKSWRPRSGGRRSPEWPAIR